MNRQDVANMLLNRYPRWSPTLYKFTLGTMVAAAIVVPLGMAAIPFIEFFNGMAAQPKGKPQMTYGRIYGEKLLVEREPVPGTIPRGHVPYPFDHLTNTVADAKLAGQSLSNPVPLTRETLEEGQTLFNVYCAVCHGTRGEGDGSIVGPDRFPAPPSLHTEQALNYADGTLYHIMTKGMGKMPSYAEQLESQDRWAVAHYLRALQRSMAPKPEDLEQ